MKTTSISMTTPDPAAVLEFLRTYQWELGMATALLAGSVVVLTLFVAWRRQRRRRAELEKSLQAVQADLGALCASVAGFGERLVRIEQQLRGVGERQDQLELHAGGDRAYNHAIRLVHKGADVQELVSTCGLNRGEAELLLRLHGLAQAS